MIRWLADLWWRWKNRAELAQADAESDRLRVESERLNQRIEGEFGPDWRAEGERRLARAFSGRYTVE